MASFNRVILMGNVTRDPELRYLASGSAVCELGMAMNRRYIRSADDVNEVIENLRPRQPVRLYFERDQQILYTDLVFQ